MPPEPPKDGRAQVQLMRDQTWHYVRGLVRRQSPGIDPLMQQIEDADKWLRAADE